MDPEARFTSPFDGGRTPSVRDSGTWRREVMRNRFEPGQVTQAGFEPGRIAVTQRVHGCYRVQHGAGGSGGYGHRLETATKDAERRDKESARGGEATSEAKLVKNSRNASDSSKRNRWPVNGRQPERQEVRPVAPGKRTARSGGRPGAEGPDADANSQTCLAPG